MINETDIAAFEADNAEALEAVDECIRRAQKGLPADRLYDGSVGMMLIAKGAHAQKIIMALQNDAMLAMASELQQRATDAMRLHSKDSKHHE